MQWGRLFFFSFLIFRGVLVFVDKIYFNPLLVFLDLRIIMADSESHHLLMMKPIDDSWRERDIFVLMVLYLHPQDVSKQMLSSSSSSTFSFLV